MKIKYFLIVGVIILLFLIVIFAFLFYNPSDLGVYQSGGAPNIGDSFNLYAYSSYGNDTYIDGVKVTLTDIVKGTSQTNVTTVIDSEQNGFTEFNVIVGNKYLITAEFNNSEKSVNCTIGPNEEGLFVGRLYIIISEINTVKDIECSPVGFL